MTPEEVDQHLREQRKNEPEDLPTGERDVDAEVATGDVGDNESNEAPALGDEESDVENEQ